MVAAHVFTLGWCSRKCGLWGQHTVRESDFTQIKAWFPHSICLPEEEFGRSSFLVMKGRGKVEGNSCPRLLALPTSAEPFNSSSWFSHFLKKCTLKADWTVLFPVYRDVLRTWISVPCCLAKAKWSHSSASCTQGWLPILKSSLPFLPILQPPPQSHIGRIRNRDWSGCVLLRIMRIRDSDLHIYKY